MTDILLAGVGGQGIVLASKLLARCAIDRGEFVRTAETIGMAQRGGCVVSHVRAGESAVSPLVPKGKADVIIGFEPAEAVRNIDYLKPKGAVVASTAAIRPVTASLSGESYESETMLKYLRGLDITLIEVDAAAIAAECGSSKVLNMALLGAACASGCIDISTQELERAVAAGVPERFLELNLKALRMAAQRVKQA